MVPVMLLMYKVLLSPLWLLWQAYNGLWWAFDDSDSRPTPAMPPAEPTADLPGPRTSRVAQDAAFEVIDTRPPPAPRPMGALRGGFIGSLVACGAFAWAGDAASGAGWIKGNTALTLWLWASCVVFVGSLWAVKNVARRQAIEKPRGWWAKAKSTCGGFKDMAIAAAASPRKVKDSTMHAAQRATSAASRAHQATRQALRSTHAAAIRHAAESTTRRVVKVWHRISGKDSGQTAPAA
jgi:hypothetical protein